MLAKNRRALPQFPIFQNSIEQLGLELSKFFPDRADVPAVLVKQDDDLKDVRDSFQDENFSIPLFTYMLDTLSPNKDVRNRSYLSNNGVVIDKIVKPKDGERLEDPWISYRTLYLTPALLTVNVYYYCSYDEQYTFAPMWQQAAQHRYLDFNMEIGVKNFFFKVELNEDLSFTPIDLDNATYLKFATSLTLHTYHGVIGYIKPATSMRVNTGIVEHGDVPDKQVLPSMQITREKSRTFSIKNRVEGE